MNSEPTAIGPENYIHIIVHEQAEELMLKTLFEMAEKELEAEGAPCPVFVNLGYYQADETLANQIRISLGENPYVASMMLIGLPTQTRILFEMLQDLDMPMDTAESHVQAVSDWTDMLARDIGAEVLVTVTSQQDANFEERRVSVRRQLVTIALTAVLIIAISLSGAFWKQVRIERYAQAFRFYVGSEVVYSFPPKMK